MEKSEKKEFPIVDNMEKTNEEQADKSVEEDEKIYEEELTLHPEFDFTQGNDKTLEQAIKKLETEKPVQRFPQLEYFGQMHGTYLLPKVAMGCTSLIKDAAQERIKYEYFREKLGKYLMICKNCLFHLC